MSTEKQKIVVILGPTAVGKSSLGIELAKKFNGEIVSADSRQVYQGMDIGSNKIMPLEKQGIKHHLIDIVSPRRNFNVVAFQSKAERAMSQIIKNNKTPFLVGGSPLYLYSVIDGWIFPKTSPNQKLRRELSRKKNQELLEILKKMDSRAAKRVDPNNARRIIRAIEIANDLRMVPPLEKSPSFKSLLIGLNAPKQDIKTKIEQRLKNRLNQGLIQEVIKLRQLPLSWNRLEAFGLEYRWVAFYLQGKISQIEMSQGIIKDTLKLIKNQMNWFKKDRRIKWTTGLDEAIEIIENFLD